MFKKKLLDKLLDSTRKSPVGGYMSWKLKVRRSVSEQTVEKVLTHSPFCAVRLLWDAVSRKVTLEDFV